MTPYEQDQIRRVFALKKGMMHYYSDRVCVNGHMANRFADSDECTKCNVRTHDDYKHCNHVLVHPEDFKAILNLAAALNQARFGRTTAT